MARCSGLASEPSARSGAAEAQRFAFSTPSLSLRASERLNGSPSGCTPLTPPAPRERLHSMAQRFAIISPCRALRALAPAPFDVCTHSPSLRIRSQARCSAPCLQDTDSSGQPSFLRFPKRIILPRSCRHGEASHRSLRLAPAHGGNRLAADCQSTPRDNEDADSRRLESRCARRCLVVRRICRESFEDAPFANPEHGLPGSARHERRFLSS